MTEGMQAEQPQTVLQRAGTRSSLDCILFLCPAYDSRYPSETMWQRLDALRELGPVRLVPVFPSPHACLEPPPGVRLERTGAPDRLKRDLFRYPARIRELASVAAVGSLRGIIWANSNLFTRRAAFAAAKMTGWPVVLDVWDVPDLPRRSLEREGRRLKSWVHWAMGYRLGGHLRAADLVIWSLHPKSAERYFRADASKTFYLPNGVRWGELVARKAALDPVRREPPGSPPRLLYMGHFRRSRGSQLLIDLIAGLRKRAPVELDVVGDVSAGEARKAIEGIPGQLRCAIRFHGHLPWDEAMELLGRASVCVYPFPHAPELDYIYPLKLLEYAAMDKWILSSDLAGAKRLLNGYGMVRFRDPGQPEVWIEAATEILENPHAPAPAGGFSPEKYDWSVLKQRLLERVWRQVIA